MGWSWRFCQNALVDATVASEVARTGQPQPDVEERVLVDHRPAPLLAPGKPILAPCVDNAIIIAWSPEESRDANRHLALELSDRGFACRVEVETARGSTAIVLMFDGIARIFMNKPSRVWRLYYDIDQLIRSKRASGEALRIVVGHIVSQFLLRRCFLSALSEVWGHIESFLGRIEVMPPRVRSRRTPLLRCLDFNLPSRSPCVVDRLLNGCEHTRARAPGGGSAPFGTGRRLSLAGVLAFLRRATGSLGPFSEARRAQLAEPPDPTTDFDCWVDSFPPPATPLKIEVSRTPAERKRRRIFAERVGVVPRLIDPFSSHTNWHRVLAGAWARADATHNKEARVSALALQRALRRPHGHGHVILGIGDNLAEILASEQGRSKDRELNAVLKCAAACQEAGDFMWKRRHVVSEKNLADFDSRRVSASLAVAS